MHIRIAFVAGVAALVAASCGGDDETTPGGTTGAAALTEEQACAHYADGVCAQLGTCSPFALETAFGSADACKSRVADLCAGVFALPDTTLTPENVDACAAAFGSLTCEAQATGANPSGCDIPGTRATGASCGNNAQCASGKCNRAADASCGECVEVAGAGEPCNANVACEGGLYCAGSVCATYVDDGGDCNDTATCNPTLACIAGKCSPGLAEGDACTAGTNDCLARDGLYCDPGTQRCVAIAVAAEGEPCGITGGALVACDGEHFCEVATGMEGVCESRYADGEACEDSDECQVASICEGGKCKKTPAACN